MDPIVAARMSRELAGKQIGGWLIHRQLGAGKSAVVFEAELQGRLSALKVFDRELVQRFGEATQLERIDRERSLIGVRHPNLVQILDGGKCTQSGYLYVAMELMQAPNLGSALTLVPRDRIGAIAGQIAKAARFLEEQNGSPHVYVGTESGRSAELTLSRSRRRHFDWSGKAHGGRSRCEY